MSIEEIIEDRRKISMKAAAEVIGVSRATYWRMVKDRRLPFEAVKKLLFAMDGRIVGSEVRFRDGVKEIVYKIK